MEGLPNSNQVFSENIKENIVFSKENRSSFGLFIISYLKHLFIQAFFSRT